MKKLCAKSLHRYVGVALFVFLALSALSGIIINHRALWAEVNVPRWLLPKAYQIEDWNNAALRATLQTKQATYLYGATGVWATDSSFREKAVELNDGFAPGADERKIVAMVQDAQGVVWAASQFRLYSLAGQRTWQEQTLPDTLAERIADLYVKGDSLMVLTRSHLLLRRTEATDWTVVNVPPSKNHEWGTLLFQIVWALHSGEFFGTAGKLAVDLLGILLIGISVTGIYFFLLRHRHLRDASPALRQQRSRRLQQLLRWHRGWGWHWLLPLLFVVVTGWALRPPLLLAFVFHRVEPWRLSSLYSSNPWHERFRAIRYDYHRKQWLLSTSTGFYVCKHLGDVPQRWSVQPPMSPMGVNALVQKKDGSWLVGSFSGAFEVYLDETKIVNYFTRQAVDASAHARPVSEHAVSGIVVHRDGSAQMVLYDAGVVERTPHPPFYKKTDFLAQPAALEKTPFSLWQYALEVHTGRIYVPFIGKIGTELFTFLFGGFTLLVLLTGWWRMREGRKKRREAFKFKRKS